MIRSAESHGARGVSGDGNAELEIGRRFQPQFWHCLRHFEGLRSMRVNSLLPRTIEVLYFRNVDSISLRSHFFRKEKAGFHAQIRLKGM